MAVHIEFEGYVNDVRNYDWGIVYDCSHAQRQMNKSNQWETVGYDNFGVSVEKAVPGVEKGGKVRVQGTLKTKRYEKKDGSGTAVALNVRAVSVEPLVKPASVSDMQELWPTVKEIPEDNAPF